MQIRIIINMAGSAESGPVLVTGGSGFIALELISQLLSKGYTVHTTVRSLQNQAKVGPLRDLRDRHGEGKLLLFEADLLQQGSFGPAMQGCVVVYHVASPYKMAEKIKDGQKEMVEPALEGTRNVLKTVEETPSVSRVIVTSSSKIYFLHQCIFACHPLSILFAPLFLCTTTIIIMIITLENY